MIVFAVLVAVLIMIPFTLRLTARDRGRPLGLRWQGIAWERVEPSPTDDGSSDASTSPVTSAHGEADDTLDMPAPSEPSEKEQS